MKNKIKRLAKGDFHIKQPEVQFPETKILMRVGEGEIYQGSFSFQNQGEETIRGLVYPSSYRVHCNEQGFSTPKIDKKTPCRTFKHRKHQNVIRKKLEGEIRKKY